MPTSGLHTPPLIRAEEDVITGCLKRSLASPRATGFSLFVFLAVFFGLLVQHFLSLPGQKQTLLDSTSASVGFTRVVQNAASLERDLDALVGAAPGTLKYPLTGYAIADAEGTLKKSGDVYGIEQLLSNPDAPSRIDRNASTYDVAVTVQPEQSRTPLSVVYRFDVRRVESVLSATLLKTVAIAVLCGFLAALLSLFLIEHFFLKPLAKLTQVVVKNRDSALSGVNENQSSMTRQDDFEELHCEVDELARDFDRQLGSERESREAYQRLTGLEARGIWEIDARSRIVYLDSRAQAILGGSTQSWQDKKAADLFELEKSGEQWLESVRQSLQKKGSWEGEFHRDSAEHDMGDSEPRSFRIQAIPKHDGAGKYTGALGTLIDTTDANRVVSELRHEARHDALTGLANRRAFDEQLDHAIKQHRSSGTNACVCMLDLDKFKHVNDNCGHAAGDLLLTQVSKSIVGCVRSSDLVARFGGDEFTLVLNNCEVTHALEVCEKIHRAIEAYRFSWDGREFVVGASIGIAALSSDLELASDVLLAADACCYKAKKAGRNQTQVYNLSDPGVAEHYGEMQWISRITDALEEDRFELYYQPIVAAARCDDTTFHSEILVRMRDRDSRSYLPGEFVGAAERYCLMGKIDRWVVSHVVAWLEQYNLVSGDSHCFAINLSSMSVSDEGFQEFLLDLIVKSAVDASCLRFEFAEQGMIRNLDGNIDFLQKLADLGCKLTIDDFGSGLSSLKAIQKLPLDFINIDGAYITNIASNELDRTLVGSIVAAAAILKARTIAKKVEDDSAMSVLDELNIDFLQGYRFARPERLATLEQLEQHHSSLDSSHVPLRKSA